jgi:MFS-type transporter involved in bile tolerance (Atg22 family)
MINEAINQFVAILMLSIFQSIATTLSLAAVCTIVPHRLNATTFGVIEVVDSLGSIIFNYCFGYLYDVKSGYRLGLVVISIVYWLGSSLVFIGSSSLKP